MVVGLHARGQYVYLSLVTYLKLGFFYFVFECGEIWIPAKKDNFADLSVSSFYSVVNKKYLN